MLLSFEMRAAQRQMWSKSTPYVALLPPSPPVKMRIVMAELSKGRLHQRQLNLTRSYVSLQPVVNKNCIAP